MTRPASYDDTPPTQRCGNCRFSRLIEYKRDLLCFFGDEIETRPGVNGTDDVTFNGEIVGILDGDEYDKIWGGRVVDSDCRCNEWRGKS